MNFYKKDDVLQSILKDVLDQETFAWADRELTEFGELCGGEFDERAAYTDRDGQPKLLKYDKYGNDQSFIWLNEGYRKTVEETYNRGIVGYLYKDIPTLGKKGNYVYSFAQGYLLSQTEPGFYCPVTLTMAAAYLIDNYASQNLKVKYMPHLASTGETELFEGATFLTERQGGSDVGANETKAVLEADGTYRLYGEKYFASNAGACGVATVLARTEGAPEGTKGLSLFLVPWRKEGGSLNGLSVRRLKDKLGVRAVPSAEVEFNGAEAYLIGEKEQGFYYMMEALNLSRICNAVASVGIMRRAYTEAVSYAAERDAFGQKIINYPMVQDSLVRMAVKLEAETVSVFELARIYDEWCEGREIPSEEKDGLLRMLIALLKSETAEQAIHFAHEAIEMHGGNGYIEDFVTPRLLRDAQVLTVWEGTANILGLEVLRLIKKYNMDDLFLQLMEKEIVALSFYDKAMIECADQALVLLKNEFAELKLMNEFEKTRNIKELQKKMVTLFESVLLLKRAENGDEKREITATIYIKDKLLPNLGEQKQSWSLEEGLKILGIKEPVKR